jgi:hypothetical protein
LDDISTQENGNWNFKRCKFLDLLQEFDLNFDFGLLRIGLTNGFDP